MAQARTTAEEIKQGIKADLAKEKEMSAPTNVEMLELDDKNSLEEPKDDGDDTEDDDKDIQIKSEENGENMEVDVLEASHTCSKPLHTLMVNSGITS